MIVCLWGFSSGNVYKLPVLIEPVGGIYTIFEPVLLTLQRSIINCHE